MKDHEELVCVRRKPRIHGYVLERMSIQELRKLSKELKIAWPRRIREKNDILDAFAKSSKIDIIAAPKPVEYELDKLRSMGVSRLRSTMADAGVFFDPRDVVEKEDMVRIFCNSGRLVLISKTDEENDRKKPAASVRYEAPDPPQEPSMNMKDLQNKTSAINSSAMHDISIENESMNFAPKNHTRFPIVETVDDEEEEDGAESDEGVTSMFGDDIGINANSRIIEERQVTTTRNHQQRGITNKEDSIAALENTMQCDEVDIKNTDEPNDAIASDSALVDIDKSHDDFQMFTETDERVAADYAMFESYKISDLRSAARTFNVDISSCIERGEMIDKLVRARNGLQIEFDDFQQWSVSDLRAVATATAVDLSKCVDRNAMVQQLVLESRARPHIASYLASLMPLVKLSVTEIRNLAREWRVNLNDCIEKEEMIHRLVAATSPSSSRA
eukprot:CAMPEP_0178904236 /NCGR_PEP_ID=MMETSP0786-20121207/5587_1 /TAXON_ID=186022 /ORGANISM="Thalassionema frauenfeldii, Strain CCMP 1798" /LENGTH=444 /DNA_ID=CAMNT_0020575669 /DNA_START=135 /DNA_END=1468 /DNA_ORIENTATION=-